VNRMTPEQKQSELQRHTAILFATFDYLMQRNAGSFVTDNFDPVAEAYEQEKQRAEMEFQQGNLDKLQQRLLGRSEALANRIDLDFAPYIKEKTGYVIDIFESLRNRIAAILEQNEIRSQKELNDVGRMIHFCDKTAIAGENVEKLKSLLTDYSKQLTEMSRKRNDEYSEVVSREEKDGIEKVTVRISTGPKPRHFEEQEAISPDGKIRLRVVQWSDGKHASTYVSVMFPTANGPVYGTRGIRPDVRAWWKDNSTIVIETKKEYTADTQHKQVRSFDDIISIEYIER
jgi:hypothetical protein